MKSIEMKSVYKGIISLITYVALMFAVCSNL